MLALQRSAAPVQAPARGRQQLRPLAIGGLFTLPFTNQAAQRTKLKQEVWCGAVRLLDPSLFSAPWTRGGPAPTVGSWQCWQACHLYDGLKTAAALRCSCWTSCPAWTGALRPHRSSRPKWSGRRRRWSVSTLRPSRWRRRCYQVLRPHADG